MNIHTVLPSGLSNYLFWKPGPFVLTSVLCPDVLIPCAISELGRNIIPQDTKSGSPSSAKDPWCHLKYIKKSEYQEICEKGKADRQISFPLSLPWTAPPSPEIRRGKLSLQLLGDGRWPGRKRPPRDEACLCLGCCGLQQAGNCTSNCILTFATSFPFP